MVKVSLVNLTIEQISLISFALLSRANMCQELAETVPDLKDSYLNESDACRALWNDLEKYMRFWYDASETETETANTTETVTATE